MTQRFFELLKTNSIVAKLATSLQSAPKHSPPRRWVQADLGPIVGIAKITGLAGETISNEVAIVPARPALSN